MGRTFRPETVAFGLSLIALGLLWTAANMGTLDLLATLRRWWPATLIVWGVLELLASYEHRTRRA